MKWTLAGRVQLLPLLLLLLLPPLLLLLLPPLLSLSLSVVRPFCWNRLCVASSIGPKGTRP